MKPIILASQSPRRKQLLAWAHIPFDTVVPHTDELFPEELSPCEAAIFIAKTKAEAVKNKVLKERIILAADTIVVLNNQLLGKPENRDAAIKMLQSLSGSTHRVITGVVIIAGNKTIEFAESTEVEFYNLALQEIEFYVDQFQPFDKAGAYGIQEWIGVIGIKSIMGDFYNVMGLPVSRVIKELNLLAE